MPTCGTCADGRLDLAPEATHFGTQAGDLLNEVSWHHVLFANFTVSPMGKSVSQHPCEHDMGAIRRVEIPFCTRLSASARASIALGR